MNFILRVKGSPTSGWYSPPKGTHSGERHQAVGSGKVRLTGKKPKSVTAVKKKPVSLAPIKISTTDELYNYATETGWPQWRDSLSDDEVKAYLRYSSDAAEVSVNEYWRHRSEYGYDKSIEDAAKVIDRTMRKNPTRIEVHRDIDASFRQKLGRMEVGDSFIDTGYVSTRLVSHGLGGDTSIILQIAKGVKVAYLAEMNAGDKKPILSPRWAHDEQELLIHKGATVVKIGMEGTVLVFEIRN